MAHAKKDGKDLAGQAIPVGPYCHPDCFDCGEPKLDVQCTRKYEFDFEAQYKFSLQMTMQNSSGAMWRADMYDPTKNEVVELGRMFFIDAPLGLVPAECRRAVVSTYSFQEYFEGGSFDSSASWSQASFSAIATPMVGVGYCQATSIGDFKIGVSLIDCKTHCYLTPNCSFASYSSTDNSYSSDGTHCMLFSECNSFSGYMSDIWVSYRKTDELHFFDTKNVGYCQSSTIGDFKVGISFTDCQQNCMNDYRCSFASYSSQDTGYSKDGTHCMLYSSCPSMSDYMKGIWVTWKKESGLPVFASTGIDKKCCYSKAADPHKEKGFVEQQNPLSVRFTGGTGVQCDSSTSTNKTFTFGKMAPFYNPSEQSTNKTFTFGKIGPYYSNPPEHKVDTPEELVTV